ncbi:MAG: citrate/2-methylcitrate synthase [Desulfobacterales bacterium]
MGRWACGLQKTGDPRAPHPGPHVQKLGERSGDTKWYDMSITLEERGAFKEKRAWISTRMSIFTARLLYHYMRIPRSTPVFAVSRIAGWTAHVIEEYGGADAKPVLYRPSSDYVGEYCGPAECAFVPME